MIHLILKQMAVLRSAKGSTQWNALSLLTACPLPILGAQSAGSDEGTSIVDRITESQNHRMFGVGRDLCGSSSPTLLPKQGYLQQAAQDTWS